QYLLPTECPPRHNSGRFPADDALTIKHSVRGGNGEMAGTGDVSGPRQRFTMLRQRRPAPPYEAVVAVASLARAASSVLRRSMAMVMGPTPPGTGVMAPATAAALSNSTSPTRPVSVRLTPTSMTVAP